MMPSVLLSWNGHEGLSGPFACRTEATMKTGPARADASGLGITGDRRGEHLPRALRGVGLSENRDRRAPYLSLEPAGFLILGITCAAGRIWKRIKSRPRLTPLSLLGRRERSRLQLLPEDALR